jgi:hypothetical protein
MPDSKVQLIVRGGPPEQKIVEFWLENNEEGVTLMCGNPGVPNRWWVASIFSTGMELYKCLPEDIGFRVDGSGRIDIKK